MNSLFCIMNPLVSCFLILGSQIGVTCYEAAHTGYLKNFHRWRVQYNKTYTGENNITTYYQHWRKNSIIVKKHNEKNLGYELEVNQFGDLDLTSWMHQPIFNLRMGDVEFVEPVEKSETMCLPNEVDWRTKGIVTGIKNQGNCGSCWTFSATGSMEGQHALKTGNLVSLSESQIVDCDKHDAGCGGGFMTHAFEYVITNKGIESEEDYPYSPENAVCMYNSSNIAATFDSYYVVKGGETGLKEAVATIGPISVAIDASNTDFQLYKSGIYYNPICSKTVLDHGGLAVGYGTTDAGEDYWLVKNSWGETWGQNGYILMARNRNNSCGIATAPSYPLV